MVQVEGGEPIAKSTRKLVWQISRLKKASTKDAENQRLTVFLEDREPIAKYI